MSANERLAAAAAALRAEGQPDVAVRSFLFHLERVVSGHDGTLGRDAITPVMALPSSAELEHYRDKGSEALPRLVVIKLNGGLGTSMGLEGAKSLLEVRGGLTFLDLIARQVTSLARRLGAPLPLALMNSFRTEAESLERLAAYPELSSGGLPLSFLQHRVPRLMADTLEPVSWATTEDLAWCPPGHGDLYPALASSGFLRRARERGFEYAFISNADNLGAVVDPCLLGYLHREGLDLLLEAADRTDSDRKGGHLCRLRGGRLALREVAQCPPHEAEEFQDIRLYRFFNTNSLWLRLEALERMLADHDGILPLPTIVNRKPLDPRDPSTPTVLQLETAMGSAVSLFPRAEAVRVPRQRFSPVKTTSDLLAVRSDAYVLNDHHQLTLDPQRSSPPTVALDPTHYRLLEAFDRRFADGPPSLLDCESFEVVGDVTFGRGVVARGRVRVTADAPASVPDGALLEGEVEVAPRAPMRPPAGAS